MAITVMVRVQVQTPAAGLDEFDFEVPINMSLTQMKVEIVDARGWNPLLVWDIRIEGLPVVQPEDTLEKLQCWDDTAIILRSKSPENSMIEQKVSTTIDYCNLDGFQNK
jgi:hypothetical protein